MHHAFKSGALLTDPQVMSTLSLLPLVISPGGTDINQDLRMPGRMETTLAALRMGRTIIAQSFDTARNLREMFPDLDGRIVHVPKASSWFGSEPCEIRKIAGCTQESILFFLPAGIRPVKGNLECLMAMKKVHSIRPAIRFIAAGPAVDAEYAERFEREMNNMSEFARWIRAISPTAMRSAYEKSDVVLNSSFSEGLSNSLLEAIAAGRPVLASDIPGNREPILGEKGDQEAGCLFDPHDSDSFVSKALTLIDDEPLRKMLGNAARLRKNRLSNPEDEADRLIAAYQEILRPFQMP